MPLFVALDKITICHSSSRLLLYVDTGLGCNDDVRGQPLLLDQYEIDIELID
jgi:hypothetical protein